MTLFWPPTLSSNKSKKCWVVVWTRLASFRHHSCTAITSLPKWKSWRAPSSFRWKKYVNIFLFVNHWGQVIHISVGVITVKKWKIVNDEFSSEIKCMCDILNDIYISSRTEAIFQFFSKLFSIFFFNFWFKNYISNSKLIL